MKKGLYILIAFFCFFINYKIVNANTINEINMDIYIDSNGNATIKEIWNVNITSGTEGYRAFILPENSTISNYSVTDDKNVTYKNISNWNTYDTFSNKAYKSGINYTSNGLELCWGISEYGNRKYTLSYDITNFVTQYTDNQGIYFKLLDLDQNVSSVTISIYSDIPFSLDNTRIWGFGYNGEVNFLNGQIIMNTTNTLSSSNYMTLLVRFENKLFNTSNISNSSFNDIFDEATNEIDDFNNEMKKNTTWYKILNFGKTILTILILMSPVLLPFIILYLLTKPLSNKSNNYGLIFEEKYKWNKSIYYRDIPCNKNLELTYWIVYRYSKNKIDKLQKGLLNAILLKWIKQNYITINENNDIVINKDIVENLKIGNTNYNFTELEKQLYMILYKASTIDNVLNKESFKRWSRKNYSQLYYWFEAVLNKTETFLRNNNLIVDQEITKKTLFEYKISYRKVIKKEVNEEAKKINGLKNYLLNFSNIQNRESFEVELWEYYLMYAQILGISKKVKKQFEYLYPDFEKLSNMNNSLSFVDSFVDSSYKDMIKSKKVSDRASRLRSSTSSSHDYSGSSRSSGGGGHSYSSGGSSSRGSSGGGFR